MTVLAADELNTDPFLLFNQWFEEAKQNEINDPDAIALASVNADSMPSVRMVLLKEVLPEGFVFYTNYNSRKSGELLSTGKAAFVVHWKSLRRQIRVTGCVEQVPDARVTLITRPARGSSRVGAWASQQSQPQTRTELAAAVSKMKKPTRTKHVTTLGWVFDPASGNRILGRWGLPAA